jgi:AcrR family transcriptional regulator
MRTGDTDRKTLLADAAIAIIGGEGLRALTHRAAETRADLPAGTCSYHYSSRRALLGAVLSRIAELDTMDIEAVATRARAEPGIMAELVTELLATWLGPARARSRARLLLMLDPQARQETEVVARALTHGFLTLGTEYAGDRERARLFIALLDGLLVDELVRGQVPVEAVALRRRVGVAMAAWQSSGAEG